jgi:hypothetical protein
MGLIRKSLAVGTIGVVSGSSKKQRSARAQLQATQELLRAVQIASGQPVATTYSDRLMAERVRGDSERARWHAELLHPDTGPNRRAQLQSWLMT